MIYSVRVSEKKPIFHNRNKHILNRDPAVLFMPKAVDFTRPDPLQCRQTQTTVFDKLSKQYRAIDECDLSNRPDEPRHL
jgi:hypothetical protein